MATRLYYYVDESGQDTQGRLFVVGVVVTDQDTERYRQACEVIERSTRKYDRKWVRVPYLRRLAYIRQVLDTRLFDGRLLFAIYHNTTDYDALMVKTIALVLRHIGKGCEATVLIDALPHKRENDVRRTLRRHGIKTRKVRGVRREENDALIRLADALAGLVRATSEGQPEMQELFKRKVTSGALIDLQK
jgi:hypothetical protein